MNFKKRFTREMSNVGQAYTRYPLTMILFVVLSVLNVFQIVDEFNGYERLVHGFLVGIVLTMVARHINERFITDRIKKWLIISSSLIISVLYYMILPKNDSAYIVYEVRTAVLVFALFFAFIWIPSIRNKTRYFYQMFLAVFKYGFTTLLYGFILTLGTQVIFFSIDILLLSINYDYFMHAANLIWFIFVPSYFLSLLPPTDSYVQANEVSQDVSTEHLIEEADAFETTNFLKVLINFIVIPLIGIYTFILIAYILLNIGGTFWTDNLLEPMLISYTITVLFAYLLACNFIHPIANYFRKIFPKILILIVVFQSIASLLKIRDMGITHGRYYVILFGLFSLTAGILFSFFRKDKTGWIVPVLVILAVFSVTPPIDAFTVAKNSQESILTDTLVKNDMVRDNVIQGDARIPQKDKERITASVDYLDVLAYTKEIEYLPDEFELYEDFEAVFGFPMTYEESVTQDELNQYAYLEWPGDQAVVIHDEDYFVELYVSNYDEPVSTTTIKIDEDYTLQLENNLPYFTLYIENQSAEEVLVMDLEPLFTQGFAASSPNEQLANKEHMTQSFENEELRVRVIATELMQDNGGTDESVSAHFYLFIEVKK